MQQTPQREKTIGKGAGTKRSAVAVGPVFLKGAVVALPDGETVAEWRIYNDDIRMKFVVGGVIEGLPQLLPEEDPRSGELDSRVVATFWPGGRRGNSVAGWLAQAARRKTADGERTGLLLTDRQREVMASVFRHLLLDQPRPPDLAKAAAADLEMSIDGVKKAIRDVKKKVNEQRDGWGLDLDELGEFLVQKTESITTDDLRSS